MNMRTKGLSSQCKSPEYSAKVVVFREAMFNRIDDGLPTNTVRLV